MPNSPESRAICQFYFSHCLPAGANSRFPEALTPQEPGGPDTSCVCAWCSALCETAALGDAAAHGAPLPGVHHRLSWSPRWSGCGAHRPPGACAEWGGLGCTELPSGTMRGPEVCVVTQPLSVGTRRKGNARRQSRIPGTICIK